MDKAHLRGMKYGMYCIESDEGAAGRGVAGKGKDTGKVVLDGARHRSDGVEGGGKGSAAWRLSKSLDFAFFKLGGSRLFSPLNGSATVAATVTSGDGRGCGDSGAIERDQEKEETKCGRADDSAVDAAPEARALSNHLMRCLKRALQSEGREGSGSGQADGGGETDQGTVLPRVRAGGGDEGDDIEDLGQAAGCGSGGGEGGGGEGGKGEMVTSMVRASLVKQGYTVVGSHSGVKLCRWTKSQLRGRGGCYKHTFYGIESHRYACKRALHKAL